MPSRPTRLFNGLSAHSWRAPRYPAREELSAEEARRRLCAITSEFFEQAERFISAREESERRQQAEIDAWVAAKRARLGLDGMTDPGVPADLFSKIERRVLADVVSEFKIKDLDAPQRLQIRAPAGVGKTAAVIEELTSSTFWQSRNVYLYVPTTALARERAIEFLAKGRRVQVIRGRSSGKPTAPMCRKYKAAEKAATLGLNVYKTLCKRCGPDGRELVCTHYDTCRWISQWKENSEPVTRILAHSYLGLPRPRPDGVGLPESDLDIVDERCVEALVRHDSFGVDGLDGVAFEAVRDNLDNGTDLRQALSTRGVTAQTARRVAEEIRCQIVTDVTPDMPDQAARQRLDQAKLAEAGKHAQLWDRVAAEIGFGRAFHGIEVCKDVPVKVEGVTEFQDRVRIHWSLRPKIGKKTPLLLIDADADPEINRIFFGASLAHKEITAARNAEVVQCSSTRLSTTALLGRHPKTAPEMTPALRKVVSIIEKEVEHGKKPLVVSTMRVREFLRVLDQPSSACSSSMERSEPWRGAQIAHFGNIRGSNQWADCDTAIIVGREQPPAKEIERSARAIWANDPKALTLAGEGRLPEVELGYRMRDGSLWGVRTPVHPDPRVQRVLEHVREREVTQAIDRLRLFNSEKRKHELILGSIPVDITVDRLRTLDELALTPRRLGPRVRLELAIKKYSVVPLGKRDLFRAFGGSNLVPSESYAETLSKEARRWLRDIAENGGTNQLDILLNSHPHLRVAEYRRAGQRGKISRVLYDPNKCSYMIGRLSLLLREEVVEFRDVANLGTSSERNCSDPSRSQDAPTDRN